MEIRVDLSDSELASLAACVEIADGGPEDVVHQAERAIRKLRSPRAAARAETFYHQSVMDGLLPMEASDDFIKGVMFHWFLSGNDYDSSETAMDVIEETFPFFKEML